MITDMKEIGGYMELEQYRFPMLYEDGLKLNSGRSCLAYLIKAKDIREIALPYFMCDSVIDICKEYGVKIRFYSVGKNFEPEELRVADTEWFYLMNYYGQLTNQDIQNYQMKYKKLIVDNAQAYFQKPINGIDTLYTCRKFFGVADGGILYTDGEFQGKLEQDESFSHMTFLLGRYERTGSEFYSSMKENNGRFVRSPVKRMSKLTENLLHSIDYRDVEKRRTMNYRYLHDRLGNLNELLPKPVEGPFAYPFLVKNGLKLREWLIRHKIYVPLLWANVLKETDKDSPDFRLAADLLPLPCDQRYGEAEMEKICNLIKKYIKSIQR